MIGIMVNCNIPCFFESIRISFCLCITELQLFDSHRLTVLSARSIFQQTYRLKLIWERKWLCPGFRFYFFLTQLWFALIVTQLWLSLLLVVMITIFAPVCRLCNTQRSKCMAKFVDAVIIIVTVFLYWYLIKTIWIVCALLQP